jgi:hypothetical protein
MCLETVDVFSVNTEGLPMSFGSQRIRIVDTIPTWSWCAQHSPGGSYATVSPMLDHGLDRGHRRIALGRDANREGEVGLPKLQDRYVYDREAGHTDPQRGKNLYGHAAGIRDARPDTTLTTVSAQLSRDAQREPRPSSLVFFSCYRNLVTNIRATGATVPAWSCSWTYESPYAKMTWHSTGRASEVAGLLQAI